VCKGERGRGGEEGEGGEGADGKAEGGGEALAPEADGEEEEEGEEEGGEEEEGEGEGTGAAEGSRLPSTSRPSPFRAWALCGGCRAVSCLPCLLPTPAAAGVGTERERSKLLATAAEASRKDGACSAAGRAGGISDLGLWYCPDCVRTRRVGGYADAPYCDGCCGPLDAPPSWDASMFDLAAQSRDPTAGAPPQDWPTPLFKCSACTQRAHGLCAWRAGAVGVTLRPSHAPGAAPGVQARQGYLCGDCRSTLDPTGAGSVSLPPSAVGTERSTGAAAAGPGNGVIALLATQPGARALAAVGQLTSDHERIVMG